MTNNDVFGQLIKFLNELEAARIAYRLRRSREEAIMVQINVPGERWEVEFLRDGDVEVERFRSDGEIGDKSLLSELLRTHSSTAELDEMKTKRVSTGSVHK